MTATLLALALALLAFIPITCILSPRFRRHVHIDWLWLAAGVADTWLHLNERIAVEIRRARPLRAEGRHADHETRREAAVLDNQWADDLHHMNAGLDPLPHNDRSQYIGADVPYRWATVPRTQTAGAPPWEPQPAPTRPVPDRLDDMVKAFRPPPVIQGVVIEETRLEFPAWVMRLLLCPLEAVADEAAKDRARLSRAQQMVDAAYPKAIAA